MNTYVCPRCRQLVEVGEICVCGFIDEINKTKIMKTPMQILIEKLEGSSSKGGKLWKDTVSINEIKYIRVDAAIEEAQSLLPKEREQIEQAYLDGLTDARVSKKHAESNVFISYDYFTKAYNTPKP